MGATVKGQAQDVSAETLNKANKKKKIAKAGSAKGASGGTVARKKPAAKKKVTKKAVTRKKATAKKKSATRKKPSPRTGAKTTPKKTSQKKRTSKRVARSASSAKTTTATAAPGANREDAGIALGDPNSIVWMVEQAEKTLIAVKAALAEQASMERAAGKLPGGAQMSDAEASQAESALEAGQAGQQKKSHTPQTPKQVAIPGSGKARKKTRKKAGRKSPAVDTAQRTADAAASATMQTLPPGPDTPASAVSGATAATGTNIVLFKPREDPAATPLPVVETATPVPEQALSREMTATTTSPTTTPDPTTEQRVESDAQTTAQAPAVGAGASKYRLARVLVAGLVLIVGLLTWRYWSPEDEAVATAGSSVPAQPEVVPQITVSETARPSVEEKSAQTPAAPAGSSVPSQPEVVPQITVSETVRPAGDEKPAAPVLLPAATTTDTASVSVDAAKGQRADPPTVAAQPPSEQPARPATRPVQEQTAQTDAAPEPAFSPPAPPSQRSRAPRYGYYPQAPAWQQQYYRPAYPRTPAR